MAQIFGQGDSGVFGIRGTTAKKPKHHGDNPKPPTLPNTPTTPAAPTPATTPAKGGKGGKGGKGNKGGKNTSTVDPNNPMYSAFKTPADLRNEAAQLAALSVPSEQYLRDIAASQQTGIAGLTNALTGTLTGLADRTQAGLAGFGNLYTNLANTAQSSGQSAAAAAGAPTNGVPGASATMASNLANLSAPTMGYAPAAAVTGAQMQGAVTANLTKALTDRANTISSDTAKYLTQLQNQEYQKSVAQLTAGQNAARLGLSTKTANQNYNIKQNQLLLQQSALDLRAKSINAKIAADKLRYGAASNKTVSGAKNSVLGADWTKPVKQDTGMRTWDVYYQKPGTAGGAPSVGKVTVHAKDGNSANASAQALIGAGMSITNSQDVGAYYQDVSPSRAQIEAKITSILQNSGMKPGQIKAWISQNSTALGLDSLSTNTSF